MLFSLDCMLFSFIASTSSFWVFGLYLLSLIYRRCQAKSYWTAIKIRSKTDSSKPQLLITQQTFVLMKMSWRLLEDVFRLRLQKTSSRRLDQDEYVRLSLTSSRRLQDVLVKTNIFVLVIRLQDVFKTSSRPLAKTFSRRFQGVFKTSCKNVFKTSSRRLEKRLQDIFKTSARRLTKISSRRFQGVSSS